MAVDEETCWRRHKMLIYCQDRWKPTPSWDGLGDERMGSWYDVTSRYQYAFDSLDLFERVDWIGCKTEEVFKGEE